MVLGAPGDNKINITLYGRPVTKKNGQMIIKNKKTGQPMIIQKKTYRAYEKDCLKQITGKHKLNISYPVNVKAIYYMPDRRRVDLTNLLEATDDILVRAGVLADDNASIIKGHDGCRVFVDRDRPRVEIEIIPIVYDLIGNGGEGLPEKMREEVFEKK